MKIKVNEASGAMLDLLVAKYLGCDDEGGVPDPEQDGDDGTECQDTEDRNPNRNGIPT